MYGVSRSLLLNDCDHWSDAHLKFESGEEDGVSSLGFVKVNAMDMLAQFIPDGTRFFRVHLAALVLMSIGLGACDGANQGRPGR